MSQRTLGRGYLLIVCLSHMKLLVHPPYRIYFQLESPGKNIIVRKSLLYHLVYDVACIKRQHFFLLGILGPQNTLVYQILYISPYWQGWTFLKFFSS
jgi:hypothetical protein